MIRCASADCSRAGPRFSIHYRGGVSRGTNLLWEINGTEGDLQLTAAGGQAQIFEMTVRGGKGAQSSLEVLPVPEQYRWAPPQGPGPSTNVAQAYARFARDYREGTHFCPTFDDAVTRHRMLNAIETAAATGQRQTLERGKAKTQKGGGKTTNKKTKGAEGEEATPGLNPQPVDPVTKSRE